MSWVTAGTQINPSSGTVLADTGVLSTDKSVGACTVFCMLSCTVTARFTFERRNAANDTTVSSQDMQIPGQNEYRLDALEYLNGERFRVITSGVIVGTAQASLFF